MEHRGSWTITAVLASALLAGCGGGQTEDSPPQKSTAPSAERVTATSAADCVAEVDQRTRVAADKWKVNLATEPRARGPFGREVAKLRKLLAACERKWPDDEGLAEAALTMDSMLGNSEAVTKQLKQQEAEVPEGKDANFYYLLGLSASNSQDYSTAITAWEKFVKLADPNDPRVPQVRESIAALRKAEKP